MDVGGHTAPVHYHLAIANDDTLTVRMTAFPSPDLPNLTTSREVLNEISGYVRTELEQRKRTHATRGTRPVDGRASSHGRDGGRPGKPSSVPNSGDQVEAVLLAEKTRKGGWKAKHETRRSAGPDPEHRRGAGRRRTGPALQAHRCFRFRQSARSPIPLARAAQRGRYSALQQSQACRRSIKPAATKEEIRCQ